MPHPDTLFETKRLTLRAWRATDLADFTRLHSTPQSMRDYGVTIDADQSRDKFNSYRTHYDTHGFIRWRVATRDGQFLGYTGVMMHGADHPLGPHSEIGWRFLPESWGNGYATEAARASLAHAFAHNGLREILAYTAADNLSSQAVMARLTLTRDPTRDFTIQDKIIGAWQGLTWFARPVDYPLGGME